jgi:AAA family ATPase
MTRALTVVLSMAMALCAGADLAALCRESSLLALNRLSAQLFASVGTPALGEGSCGNDVSLDNLVITAEDMSSALKVVRPSTLREVLVDVPKVLWSDIGGQEDTKQKLKEAVEWPLKVRSALNCRIARCPPVLLTLGGGAASRGIQANGHSTTTRYPSVWATRLQQDPHG